MVFDNCFDKTGKLVRTPYPKDLILGHFDQRRNTGKKLIFWKDWVKMAKPRLREIQAAALSASASAGD